MTKLVTRLFDNYADAEAAVTRLEQLGVPHTDISLVANNADGARGPLAARGAGHAHAASESAHDSGEGAGVGGVAGGAVGLLAGLGLLAIPGLGPVVAAGWLASTAVGAVVGAVAGGVAGGLVGALTHAGVHEDDAHVYAEGVRRGGTLVSARVADDLAPGAEAALDSLNGVDAAVRGEQYRAGGWTAFNPDAAPYAPEDVARERPPYLT